MNDQRNVNPDIWMLHLYDNTMRELAFHDGHVSDFDQWRGQFLATLEESMYGMPSPTVPLEPLITDSVAEDGYSRHRLLLQTEPMMNVPCWLLIPDGVAKGERRPAVLALHGHGPGRDEIVGIDRGDPRIAEHTRATNGDYARQFVRHGYIVLAPDHRGFGERSGTRDRLGDRDYCNLLMIKQALLGRNPLMSNIYDACRCLDYLETRPDVDADRMGAVGLSYGGTMTLFTTALEPRIKVACVSCYMNSFRKFALEMNNFCGNQMPSRLVTFAEMWDVAISIAPRPLLLESGIHDHGFPFEQSKLANEKVRAAYEALGYGDRIAVDEFPGGHEFSGRLTFDWFAKWLDFNLDC